MLVTPLAASSVSSAPEKGPVHMRLSIVTVAAGAATAAFALGACGGSSGQGSASSGSPGGSRGDQLVLGAVLAPATFEAANMNWGNQSVYAQAVYDSLLRQAPNGTDVEPGLATSWQYNEDRTVLTMKLRSGVTFSDGTPFTAAVAAQNLMRFKNGSSPQRPKVADMTGAKALDDTTLEIRLKQPNPAFLVYLSQAAGLQASPKAFKAADAKTRPVGTGPYVLDTKSTVVGSSYVFTRNPKYWDPSTVKYNKLKVNVYTDPTSELNALRGRQLNAAVIGQNSIVPQVKQAGFDVETNRLQLAGVVLFDRGGKLNKALGDVRVRQAINHAFDKKALLKVVGLGHGEVDDNVFRSGSPAYDAALKERYPFDPAKAKALLAEAGYPNGFKLVLPTNASFGTQIPALVQQQLRAVGIQVSYVDTGQNLLPDLLSAKYAASYFTLQKDPNAFQLVDFMLAPGATWNVFRYDDPKATALIDQARNSDGAQQDEALKQLNRYVVEQAWFAKWFTGDTQFVTDDATKVTIQADNIYPNLWDIAPAA
jgi:peptide/nickel transport system substrate-binding protein